VRPLFGYDSPVPPTRQDAEDGVDGANDGPAPGATPAGSRAAQAAPSLTRAHPEVYVAAAFLAGVAIAILARRLGR